MNEVRERERELECAKQREGLYSTCRKDAGGTVEIHPSHTVILPDWTLRERV